MKYLSNNKLKNYLDLQKFKSSGYLLIQDCLDPKLVSKCHRIFETVFSKSIAEKLRSRAKNLEQNGYIKPGVLKAANGDPNPLEAWSIIPNFEKNRVSIFSENENYLIARLRESVAKIAIKFLDELFFSICELKKADSRRLYEGFLYSINYPKFLIDEFGSTHRQGEHTDTSLITIMLHSNAKGLLIKKNNRWVELEIGLSDVLIISGNSLKNFSQGNIKPLPHYVRLPREYEIPCDRLTFVYFVEFILQELFSHPAISKEITSSIRDEYEAAKAKNVGKFD